VGYRADYGENEQKLGGEAWHGEILHLLDAFILMLPIAALMETKMHDLPPHFHQHGIRAYVIV
jgi:hypothetical protein